VIQTSLKIDTPAGGDKLITERLAAQEILEGATGAPSHASDHITGGSDEIDGDKLDIDWTPSNYTPSTSPSEADSLDNLTAHLYGIDQGLGTTASHASTHITSGSDEIDGDKLDIDWAAIGYTPSTTPAEADSLDNLTAHLYGVGQELSDKIDEDGSVPLTANWDIGNTRAILADTIRARDGDGLNLQDDGGNGIFVEDGGQIGIGTSSPVRLLHIGGGGQSPTNSMEGIYVNPNFTTAQITAENSSGVEGGMNPHSDSNFYLGTWSNHPLQLTTNNVAKVTVLADGKVGIGQSAPARTLHVGGGAQSPTNSMDGIYVNPNATTAQVTVENSNSVEGGMNPHSDNVFYLGTWSNHPVQLSTNNTSKVTILADGKVGIGITSPARDLHIGDGSQTPTNAGDGLYVNPDGNSIQITAENNLGDEGGILVHSDGITYIGSVSSDNLALMTGNSARVVLDTSGDMLIGAGSASGQLHVDQSSTSGAQPVLYLDQADVSEEFIRFQATAGDSNAVSTNIVGSHYGRVRVNVNGTDMWMPVFNDDSTSDWTGVTFASGWSNLSGAQTVEYRKIGDIVYLRGTTERTSGSGTTIFTLPSGYRPPAQLRLANRSRWSNAIGELPSRMTISSAGVVSMTGAIVNSENWLSLDGYNFSVTT